MLFGLHTLEKSLEEYLQDIAEVANSEKTLIFLDTNVISYLYKLHDAARREFFDWTDQLVSKERLAVPAWAASEYLSRVTARNLKDYMPKGKEAGQASSILEGLVDTASLFVDESILKKIDFEGDRVKFISEFRSAVLELKNYTRAFEHSMDSSDIHKQVEVHLSSSILKSNIAALCRKAAEEGPSRVEHRLPPGFKDAQKGENRLGDLIIWFEILAKATSVNEKFDSVIFISRDEKSDWVYAPSMRMKMVGAQRKSIGNKDPVIKISDPRLVNEFQNISGINEFSIVNFDVIIEALSNKNPSQFTFLAAAIQVNQEATQPNPVVSETEVKHSDDLTKDSIEGVNEIDGEVDSGVSSSDVYPIKNDNLDETLGKTPKINSRGGSDGLPLLSYGKDALSDRVYKDFVDTEINKIIRDLKSLNWYAQNPAVMKIREIRERAFSDDAWFVLGRNLYQAACGNSQKAMSFIDALDKQLELLSEAGKHVLAGALFEIYFDSSGEFRRELKFGYAEAPLRTVQNEKYSDVLEFIKYSLHAYRDRLGYFPGDENHSLLNIGLIEFKAKDILAHLGRLGAVNYRIEILEFNGCDLLVVPDEVEKKSEDWTMRSIRTTVAKLRDEICNKLGVPKWNLKLEISPEIDINDSIFLHKDKKIDIDNALLKL